MGTRRFDRKRRRSSHGRLREAACLAAAAIVLISATSCLEPPVTERLDIRFEGRDGAVVTTTVELTRGSGTKGRVVERLDQLERDLVDEADAWSRRLRALEPPRDVWTLERKDGRVVRATREVRLASRDSLIDLVPDAPLSIRYDEREGWAEFSIVPGGGGPATYQERRRVQAEMDAWARRVVPYIEAVGELWRYLDARPERARPCLAALFDEGTAGEGSLGDDEEALVDAVEETGGLVLEVFEIPAEEADSLDERVRRVYDPFPAPVVVTVPGTVLESEGFRVGAGGTYEIDALGLWNAFRSLEGQWIAPDPVVASWLHEQRGGGGDFDLDGFAAKPRFVSAAPPPGELVRSLERALRPQSIYRVLWDTAPDEESDADDEGR